MENLAWSGSKERGCLSLAQARKVAMPMKQHRHRPSTSTIPISSNPPLKFHTTSPTTSSKHNHHINTQQAVATMPPARRTRTPSGPAVKGAQKTLSFGNKVSKPPTAVPQGKDVSSISRSSAIPSKAHPLSKSVDIDVEPQTAAGTELDLGHTNSAAAVTSQAQAELAGEKSKDVLKAERVTDAQIKKYWKEREAERMTRRVHQEELGVEEKILRLWDMSSQFGVCLFPPPNKPFPQFIPNLPHYLNPPPPLHAFTKSILGVDN